MLDNASIHTDILTVVEQLRRLIEFAPFRRKNHNSEDVVGIWLIQVEKCWLPFAAFGVFCADNFATDGLRLVEEFRGIFWRYGGLLLGVGEYRHERNK